MKTSLYKASVAILLSCFIFLNPTVILAQKENLAKRYVFEFGAIICTNGPGKLMTNHMTRNGFTQTTTGLFTQRAIEHPRKDPIGIGFQFSFSRILSKKSLIGLQYRYMYLGSAWGAKKVNDRITRVGISFKYNGLVALYNYQINKPISISFGPAVVFTEAKNKSKHYNEKYTKTTPGILGRLNYRYVVDPNFHFSFNVEYLSLLRYEMGPFTSGYLELEETEVPINTICFSHFGAGLTFTFNINSHNNK